MAWTEADRVKIRRWMGASAIFLQADPRMESAITAVQSVADGGTRPDNTTELAIREYLTELAAIETQWKAYYEQMQATAAEQIRIDPLRGLAGLKQLGRHYVGSIADALAMQPIRDVFVGKIPSTH